ncbi:hypothetical protein AYO20_08426 [Fonsecaea nubica]|uniref:Uncharacterized protein n=1 Tax=Fonsecaea nubica TaxID=856822 RepID=A0A178CQ99_9EURO|nr:hypothetical protein AYO20_08426 [Fonsecaea nubica]OAL31095.1 hypothetical protein AYO20_08426 [Fonsecaea nubica]
MPELESSDVHSTGADAYAGPMTPSEASVDHENGPDEEVPAYTEAKGPNKPVIRLTYRFRNGAEDIERENRQASCLVMVLVDKQVSADKTHVENELIEKISTKRTWMGNELEEEMSKKRNQRKNELNKTPIMRLRRRICTRQRRQKDTKSWRSYMGRSVKFDSLM